jgi:predicted acetyltransferase
VLVTCLQVNVASARIIEANGGALENVIEDPAGRGPFAPLLDRALTRFAHQPAGRSPSQ